MPSPVGPAPIALLMGEFSDSFLTVVAAMVMLYGLRSTLLQ